MRSIEVSRASQVNPTHLGGRIFQRLGKDMLDLPPRMPSGKMKVYIGVPYYKCNNFGDDWHPGMGVYIDI